MIIAYQDDCEVKSRKPESAANAQSSRYAGLHFAGPAAVRAFMLEVAHILVVEDDANMRHLLMRFLSENGFRATGARDGVEMWNALDMLSVDMVLLDVMLPGTMGLDLCRAIRQKSQLPIIMVTARGSETDRVLGLELGADDYVPKPFSRAELLARIRAVLRRGKTSADEHSTPRGRFLQFGDWTLDKARLELVSPGGAVVELSGAEYDVLLMFLEHPQIVLTRDRILELSRNRVGEVFDRSVDVLISRLRRKLDLGGAPSNFIKTVRGTGYMFIQNVQRQ